jgi:hypothetical protein
MTHPFLDFLIPRLSLTQLLTFSSLRSESRRMFSRFITRSLRIHRQPGNLRRFSVKGGVGTVLVVKKPNDARTTDAAAGIIR